MNAIDKAKAKRARRAARADASTYAARNSGQEAELARMPYVQRVADRIATRTGKVYLHGIGEVDLPDGVTVQEFYQQVEAAKLKVARRLAEEKGMAHVNGIGAVPPPPGMTAEDWQREAATNPQLHRSDA